ncbi:hypothetical protein ACO0RG_003759 [Hanseniaspora osmophila]
MSFESTKAVVVDDLTFKYPNSNIPSLQKITLSVDWNTTNLIIGSNGAGKSTLLKILAGKKLCLNGNILINGVNPFSSKFRNEQEFGMNTCTYFGTEWCHQEIINRDIGVLELLDSLGYSQHFKTRGDLLISILEIDVNWRMFKLSDGLKRRVQLVMGLLKPFKVLLLDEVTVDLDVVARCKLLDFLKNETKSRQCTIIYATHIFDGLNDWPNRIVHIHKGQIVDDHKYSDIEFLDSYKSNTDAAKPTNNKLKVPKSNSLHPLALSWLLSDQKTEL